MSSWSGSVRPNHSWFSPGRKGGGLSRYSILRCTGMLSGKSSCRMPCVASCFSQTLLGLACFPLLQDGQATVRLPGAVAKRRVNMLQRSRPAVNRRAAIVATGAVGKDGDYIGGCQFWAAIAPIGEVGPDRDAAT